ncbi:MAG: hypothetical protein ACKV2T_31105 [Kofleriaceae bacterium]
MSTSISIGLAGSPSQMPDPDEALCTRLRDLALVDLDSFVAGARAPQELIAAYADDVADALREVRTRITALRTVQAGPDPLLVLDVAARQRASDTASPSAERTRQKLVENAAASRSLARLSELAAPLVGKLFEADRRR